MSLVFFFSSFPCPWQDVRDDVCGAIKAGLLGVLVKTGKYRPGDESTVDPKPSFVAENFAEAVDHIISNWLT